MYRYSRRGNCFLLRILRNTGKDVTLRRLINVHRENHLEFTKKRPLSYNWKITKQWARHVTHRPEDNIARARHEHTRSGVRVGDLVVSYGRS